MVCSSYFKSPEEDQEIVFPVPLLVSRECAKRVCLASTSRNASRGHSPSVRLIEACAIEVRGSSLKPYGYTLATIEIVGNNYKHYETIITTYIIKR